MWFIISIFINDFICVKIFEHLCTDVFPRLIIVALQEILSE